MNTSPRRTAALAPATPVSDLARRQRGALLVAALACTTLPARARAQDDRPPPGWYNTTELTAVWAAGNARSSTFGFKNELRRLWEKATLSVQVGGLRTESTMRSRRAVGSATSYQVIDSTTSDVTAENYSARARLDRAISERTFVYASIGWLRNTFAGVESRYTLVGGLGNTWVDRESASLKTDYGVTYTVQNDVAGDERDTFAGLRFGAEAKKEITATTKYTGALIVDENLDETSDLRVDLTNAIAVTISDGLALKTSLQLLFDNQPSPVRIPLFGPGGQPLGEEVTTALKKLDSLFTVALVIDL